MVNCMVSMTRQLSQRYTSQRPKAVYGRYYKFILGVLFHPFCNGHTVSATPLLWCLPSENAKHRPKLILYSGK